MKINMTDKERRDFERNLSVHYFMEKYSREQRYLKLFARDFSSYLQSAAWLQSDDARNFQKFYDFITDFENLKAKMKEFRWSKEFLAENGIDFTACKKLYFAVA